MKKTHEAITGTGSSLTKYQDVMVGKRSLAALVYYEWCQILGVIPGALGLALRSLFWPKVFARCGKGCQFAAGIVLRQPYKIALGDNVILSEGCVLDGRHYDDRLTIHLGNGVMISNQVMISCKNGTISIGDHCGINSQSIIQSAGDCPVDLGPDCLIGQRCFLIGGGSYHIDRTDIPIRLQGNRPDTGIRLEADVWLGANVTVLGGVVMGQGSVAGAGAVLTRSVAPYTVSLGVPAQVVRMRKGKE